MKKLKIITTEEGLDDLNGQSIEFMLKLWKKAKNFIPVALQSIRNILRGRAALVDPETAINRIKICESCDQLTGRNRDKYVCKICECRIRYKVRLASSSCPINKWSARQPV